MPILQDNRLGENRVIVTNSNGYPVAVYIQRSNELNLNDIVHGTVVEKLPAINACFIKTDLGFVFVQQKAPLFIGQGVCVKITKEARAEKCADGVLTDSAPVKASDIAVWLSETLNEPISDWQNGDELLQQAVQNKIKITENAELFIEKNRTCWSIDVDTGTSSFALTNKTAIEIIAREIVLKNLSGLIVVDFAGKKEMSFKTETVTLLKKELQSEKNCSILGFTRGGLLEIRRKREFAPLWDKIGFPEENLQTSVFRLLKEISVFNRKATLVAPPEVIAKIQQHNVFGIAFQSDSSIQPCQSYLK